MPLRVGFIGAGPRARVARLPSIARLQQAGEITLTAICDLDEQRLASSADRYGVGPEGRYTDYRRMLGEARLDVVDATLQPTQVMRIVRDVLDAGVHAFTEKPPGISLAYCDDPLYDPLMECCAAHDVPVLQHTWKQVGPEGPGSGNFPNEATPERLLTLARRHPRVKFCGGHGGGDWEWGVAAYKQVDNIWLDMGGGEAINGFMELALRALGPSRIVFGTDIWGRSIPSQVSRIVACDASDADKERMYWRNAVEIFGERLPSAWREHFAQ